MSWDKVDIFYATAIAILVLLLAILVTWETTRDSQREQAIEHNAAEWRIDAKTGEKEFVWLTDEQPQRD